ncbi:CaiB/BaiF CoA-transferase family protein [uncultured Oscillibacter sp.]|uniref:CaiB/BaiF CoA transferase family protein n=1 Tax=uncultured Oscillibacter sp. TaxID=876091 RepID=UPI0025DCFBC6|nr:CaiB/BaiF CoA-transferase family protein [uncultured Oscillibacter sp.]
MLENLKVLAFTHYLQGPSCAQMFGDLGADVIKVESPKGAFERSWSGPDSFVNGVSVFFMLANRNMRSIAVNLKSEEGKRIIYELVRDYDIVIENFRPGVMEKLGFGYEALKARNPRVIYCSLSGFGSTGPYKDRPGQDLLAQSMGGIVDMTGTGRPSPVGTSFADAHSATLAAVGILAAVNHRQLTGEGHKIDVNLVESVLNLQMEPYAYYLNTPEKLWPTQLSTGLANRFQSSPYGVYETQDGYISISLCKHADMVAVLEPGCLDGFTEQDAFTRRDAYDAVVAAQLKKKTTDEWCRLFTQQGIWHIKPYTYQDIENDPQVQWNKSILTLHHPVAGDVRVLNHPIKYDGESTPLRRNPPAKGADTREVLSQLGYTDQAVEELRRQGVLTWDDPV